MTSFDTSVLRHFPKEASRVDRRRLQRLQRSESRRDESLQLEVEADARRHVDTGRRVRSREERHARGVQLPHDVELVIDEFASDT
jgi:hypothetical protein